MKNQILALLAAAMAGTAHALDIQHACSDGQYTTETGDCTRKYLLPMHVTKMAVQGALISVKLVMTKQNVMCASETLT